MNDDIFSPDYLSYCYRCRKHTTIKDHDYHVLKNNNMLIKGYCGKCWIKKKIVYAKENEFDIEV